MGVEQAPTKKGRDAAEGLRKSTAKEEKKIEAQKGSDLAKGPERFEERSKSSDGKSAGAKQ
ncbi:hypothetical protein OE766_15255 [Pararhizobium sp. YC-54]|uniref:hypothetical protein n=1 Tax=Pararhizobium sp. YC-54 TaxID=2986920 RepID=UPI0021F742E3|nr:hypothetical protein [Pararhizobium sp. YC-54]MCV9999600.1 hypothetical protein [Pararhizobium sp. YC-54]